MTKHLSNLLYKPFKKNNRRLLLCAAIFSVGIGILAGCSANQTSADEPAVADTPPDAETQTVSDIDPGEPIDLSDESWSVMTLAYVHGLEDGNLSFDTVEWVDVPSDRAKELGIEEEHLDSGFYVHNEAEHIETLPLSEDCSCTLLDWADSYQPVETAIKDLPAILEERKDQKIPYELTIQSQKITNIQEHYVP